MILKRLLLLTILLGILIVISGCRGTLPPIKPVQIYCPTPFKPQLDLLDESKSICEEENIKLLLTNFNLVIEYSKKLETTVECYQQSMDLKTKDKKENASK